MAFSRSFLKSCGLTEEQQNAVIEEYNTALNEVKRERDTYKADAEKLPKLQEQLDQLKGIEDYKTKYEKEHGEFEAYKTKVSEDERISKVKSAYRKLLTEEKINEKRLDAVMRLTDFSGMKLDKDGNLQDSDKLKKAIADEWSEYKVTTEERGPVVPTPPKTDNGGKILSRAAELAAQYHAQKYGVPATQKE